jgi:hypothetical protein
VLARRIPFAVIALHVFGGSIVSITVEVNRYEGHARGGKLVALRQDGGLCRGLWWLKWFAIILLRLLHRTLLSWEMLRLFRARSIRGEEGENLDSETQ